jgi:hypothetical protein
MPTLRLPSAPMLRRAQDRGRQLHLLRLVVTLLVLLLLVAPMVLARL